MKIAIILCLFTGSCFAQTKHPETDFYLENNKMYWEHTYEVLSKSTDDLIKYFQKEVLINIKQDNFQIIDNTISFEVNDDKVNFKKYGGTAMGTAFIAQLFMKYLVVIDFKDNKYRVTVKDIFLDNFNKFKITDKHKFYEFDYKVFFKNFEKTNSKINFYFYDGEHSYKNQYDNLEIANNFFVKDTIVLVDDINFEEVEQGTEDFIRKNSSKFRLIKKIKTKNNHCHPTYWNGIMIFQKN